MPSTYAHYRLGKELLPQLPAEVQQTVTRFRRMYDMGLQGPDLFFYYNPLVKTPAGSLGGAFHSQSGKEFFQRSAKAAATEAGKAYLYGLLVHYALDSACHPFVNRKVEAGEAEHVPMEKEFERYLLEMDGEKSPATRDLGEKIALTRGECVTVAAFYPGSTPGQINASVKNMAWSLSFLAKEKKGLLWKLAQRVAPELLDHGVPAEPKEGAERLNSELLARYNWAARDYGKLLEQLQNYLKTGEELGEDFEPAFG